MAREDEIRLIAYRIWEEEGCVDGQDCEHWFQAETIWEQDQKAAAAARVKPKQASAQKPKAAAPKKKSGKS